MSEELTPWFPGDVQPARVGVYERRDTTLPYCFWNGYEWEIGAETLEESAAALIGPSSRQGLEWRGLASDPKAKA